MEQSDDYHDFIMEEIFRRESIEHVEENDDGVGLGLGFP